MRTLKISVVATVASVAAWWLHFPNRIWPEHPLLASFILVFVLCIALQLVWSDAKPETKQPATKQSSGERRP